MTASYWICSEIKELSEQLDTMNRTLHYHLQGTETLSVSEAETLRAELFSVLTRHKKRKIRLLKAKIKRRLEKLP